MPKHVHNVAVEFDELTDLPNLLYFRRYAGAFVRRSQDLGRRCYLIYFALENFGGFCEHYGLIEGDELLSHAAWALRISFPGYLLARVSEDRFMLVCESHDVGKAVTTARDHLRDFARHFSVELKAGVYLFQDDNVSVSIAADRAKVACDSIRGRYDQTWHYYDDALRFYEERRNYIESNIDRAVEQGWIRVFYQPVVRTITGEVSEFEALARWDDPHYGMLSPAVFIDVLERSRLIHKLDACVIEQVCAEWHRIAGIGPWRMPVSVNLSRHDFTLTDPFEMVNALARKYDVPHQMLHIEITESAITENEGALARQIKRFRDANYQVWLDDFGSGYSSLNTLKTYVFDVVKIDMAFLREFDSNPKSRVIISNIVNMAKQLGMQTLIEGVETAEQFDFLHNIGCEFCQGYLIGRPAASEANMERIMAGELVMEDTALHGYYDRLGAVNSLSATPFDFSWDAKVTERPFAEMLPLAIIERTGRTWTFVTNNESFVTELKEIGFSTMSVFAKRVNAGADRLAQSIAETLSHAAAFDGIESLDVFENGKHCMLRIRRIASHGDTCALLLSILNLARFQEVSEENLLKTATGYLYAVYDLVNIVDLRNQTMNTIYRGSAWFPALERGIGAREATTRFCHAVIHPKDWDRYGRFMQFDTVATRAERASKNALSEAFRALAPDGTYCWITCVLVPLEIDGTQTVILGVRATNTNIVDTVSGEEEIPKSVLWDTLLELVPAGIFWKDRDRRFVGVNRNFLDFYEFSSTDDVLGKTDEDMGWHVDEQPFKNSELRVIERGEPVLRAKGTCISHGEVRDIVASKVPLVSAGQIVGLMGYFTDQTDTSFGTSSFMLDGFARAERTDELTRIANASGLASSCQAYADAYVTRGDDFCLVLCDIRDMGGLNEVYGHAFGNRILQVVARTLERSVGVSGAVARVGGDKFAIVFKVADVADARRQVSFYLEVLAGIEDVDGIRVDLGCSVGWALYSEVTDIDELSDLAEQRLAGEAWPEEAQETEDEED